MQRPHKARWSGSTPDAATKLIEEWRSGNARGPGPRVLSSILSSSTTNGSDAEMEEATDF